MGDLITLAIAVAIVLAVWFIVAGIILLLCMDRLDKPSRYDAIKARVGQFLGAVIALVQVSLVRAFVRVRALFGVRIKRMGDRASPAKGWHVFFLTPWATVAFTVSWMAR